MRDAFSPRSEPDPDQPDSVQPDAPVQPDPAQPDAPDQPELGQRDPDQPEVFRHLDVFAHEAVTGQPGASGRPPQEPARHPVRGYVLTALISAVLTLSLAAGMALAALAYAQHTGRIRIGAQSDPLSLVDTSNPENQAALEKLHRIYALVDNDFVDDLTDAEMIEAMARGLVTELDNPYTFYLSAEQNRRIAESFSGNYSGIGAIVAMNKDGQAEVAELTPGSPAIQSGVRIGDIFIAVDGKDVSQINDITELAALVRGTEGTRVAIRFYRPSTREMIDMTVERRAIASTTITSRMLETGIGYIQIREFSSGVSEKFLKALDQLKNAGARHVVIDLRSNSGGLANEVLDLLDNLLPEVEMTRFVGRRNGQPYTEIKQSAASSRAPADMRYAILINGMTASASELMAGCLRDHDKARLIGEKSFGKGSGVITVPLGDDSAVSLTNFLYYLPDGENIEGKGLTPDETVTLPAEAQGQSLALLDPAQDTQLQAGLTWLRSQLD